MSRGLKWTLGVFGAMVVIGALAPDREQPADPTPAAAVAPEPPKAKEWVKLKEWRGTGMKNTEIFTITGSQWRIQWAAKPNNEMGIGSFAIMVHRGSQMTGIAANIANTEGSDVDYQSTQGGHRLQINTANMAWAVLVEEER